MFANNWLRNFKKIWRVLLQQGRRSLIGCFESLNELIFRPINSFCLIGFPFSIKSRALARSSKWRTRSRSLAKERTRSRSRSLAKERRSFQHSFSSTLKFFQRYFCLYFNEIAITSIQSIIESPRNYKKC